MQINLLGSPRILIDQRPLETLRRKNRALIYYLAARPEPVTRDQLLALFWPDTPRSAAQQTLRTMLHDLRRLLPPDFLVIDEDHLSLGTQVRVDARDLKAALFAPAQEIRSLTAALDRYRGDFLDGFTLSDAPSFDDWAQEEREAYRTLAIRGFAALGRLQENARNLPAALEALNRALSLDPLQEDLQREALRLHYLNGDRPGAIRRYEALCRLLDEELGVPPMPETRALYDAIVTDTMQSPTHAAELAWPFQPPAVTRPLLPFTGRFHEFETLTALSVGGKMILVEGPPGIGKTRLIQEYIAARQTPSPLVLVGLAHELEQGLPYQPVIDALRGLLAHPDWPNLRAALEIAPYWLAEITRLAPEFENSPAAAAPIEDEARLWEAVHQLLQGLSRRRPLVFFLEDLHWADAATIGLIGFLARRAASPSILLIGTTRRVEPHSKLNQLVKALLHEERLARLSLSPLTAADTLQVAGQLSPANADFLSRWLADSAEGNPYFLTELVRHALASSLLQKNGQLDRQEFSTAQILPPTVQNLILSRLLQLSEGARRVVDVAAVIGRQFDFELVYQVVSLQGKPVSEEELLDAFEELKAAVLIQPSGSDRFSFDHSLTLEVALQEMGEIRSRLLHRQVAQALERLYAERLDPVSGLIAYHFARSASPKLAAPYAFRAGKHAAGLAAWDEAIAFFEQALADGIGADLRPSVFIALGNARFHKGDFFASSQAYERAIQQARERGDLASLEAAYLGLNLSLLPQSRFAEAIALGRELASSGPPELALCAQFTWGAGLALESAHPEEAEAHLREAQKLIQAQTDYHGPITPTLIQYQLAGVVGQRGDSRQAAALYQEALDAFRRDETALDLLRQIMIYNDLGYHLNLLGDPEAASFVKMGIHLAEERGSLTHLPYLFSTSGEIALSRGDLDEAQKQFSHGLDLARQVPIPERIAGLTANLGLVAYRRGDLDQARQCLLDALALADQLGVGHLAVRIRCWLVPLLSSEEAPVRLREARDIAQRSGFALLLEEIEQLEREISSSSSTAGG